MAYSAKVSTLEKEIIAHIKAMVNKKGKKTNHADKAIILKDDVCFNIDGTYLTEVSTEHFYTKNGIQYSFNAIDISQLAEIADSL